LVTIEDYGRVPDVKVFEDDAAADSQWRSRVDA
jgi:hypothetical protein